jgi:hypothetical protein
MDTPEPIDLARVREDRAKGIVGYVLHVQHFEDYAVGETQWRIAIGGAVDAIAGCVGGLSTEQRIAVTRAVEQLADDLDCMRPFEPWGLA